MTLVYFVGFIPDDSRPFEGGSVGIFSTLELAKAACIDRRYTVVAYELDAGSLADRIDCPPQWWRPNLAQPDPQLVTTQLAAIAECRAGSVRKSTL